MPSFHMGRYLGVGLPYIYMLYIYIYHILYIKHFKKMPSYFTLFYIPTSNVWLSSFSTSSPKLVIVCLSNYSHPSGCKVVSYYGTVGPVYLLVPYLWIQKADCTMPFYIRDLSILGFWYPQGFWNQSPMHTEG